ncbi:MAG: ribosome maturation factor RimM [Treponema sp.]|nr:ribosome maturation factor RimM [Treponema sp.]
MTEQFVVALVGAPFGVKGFVKVKPLSGEIDHLLPLKSVLLRQNGKTKDIEIEESAPSFPGLVMKFHGFDSPEAAKALSGAELVTDREHASPLKPGEYYVEDLRGLAVKNGDTGDIIGHITDIIEGGGGDLAEIKLLTGGERKLVPFRSGFFSEIQPEKGNLTLLQPWVLE